VAAVGDKIFGDVVAAVGDVGADRGSSGAGLDGCSNACAAAATFFFASSMATAAVCAACDADPGCGAPDLGVTTGVVAPLGFFGALV
jgi:hypothetical protein